MPKKPDVPAIFDEVFPGLRAAGWEAKYSPSYDEWTAKLGDYTISFDGYWKKYKLRTKGSGETSASSVQEALEKIATKEAKKRSATATLTAGKGEKVRLTKVRVERARTWQKAEEIQKRLMAEYPPPRYRVTQRTKMGEGFIITVSEAEVYTVSASVTGAIETAFEPLLAFYYGEYLRIFTRMAQRFVEQFPMYMGNRHSSAFNSREEWMAYERKSKEFSQEYRQVRSLVTEENLSTGASRYHEAAMRVNEAGIKREAESQAELALAGFRKKISEKLVGVTDAVIDLDKSTYRIGSLTLNGQRDGRTVVVNQSSVLKQSSLGKWYYQFPALIYVDGNRVTEAAFLKGDF